MSFTTTDRTPGVYLTEEDAFSPSIMGVETALPAFVGYTQRAAVGSKPVYFTPRRIRSMTDYEAVFGGPFKQRFDIHTADMQSRFLGATGYDFSVMHKDHARTYYKLDQRDAHRFMLYYGMRLFFDNGGEECFVVSCGPYAASNDPGAAANVVLSELERGLDSLTGVHGPTMVVIPDAVVLNKPDFQSLTRKMLQHCAHARDRLAIVDVWGTDALDSTNQNLLDPKYLAVIGDFREAVGAENLSYGAAYFPFLNTSVVAWDHVDYRNIASDSSPTLAEVLSIQADALYRGEPQRGVVKKYIDEMATADTPDGSVHALEHNLKDKLPVLGTMEKIIIKRLSLLPPSAAIAGIFARNDAAAGVWKAPANVEVYGTVGPSILVDEAMQEDLNVPRGGKAINPIRHFLDRDTIVWGARTLNGNSRDWRYIQVCRTMIYIEQSLKLGLSQFVFAANDRGTWTAVISMTSDFLKQLWNQGVLIGATAAEAYRVRCGLGSTMTSQDVLDGYMIVDVDLQMSRPSEFIELTLRQKMEGG